VTSPDTENSLVEQFRSEMPVAARYAYFDHAAVAPLPQSTRTAIATWLEEATEHGDTRWPRWAETVRRLRTQTADLVGAQFNEIALVPNTTSGLGIVAEGWPWQEGDNVITLANEFPSNLYPWMNLASRGVEARLVPVDGGIVDLERLESSIDDRTRLLSISRGRPVVPPPKRSTDGGCHSRTRRFSSGCRATGYRLSRRRWAQVAAGP
jgi:cysteine desulfurase / selenocysteine lyase